MTNFISGEDLCHYNRQGLIPGPNESESEFLERVAYCLNIRDHLADQTGVPLPEDYLGKEPLPEGMFASAKKLYDISPNWVPIVYDDHKLSIWHGGCAWIFQCDEGSPLSAILQLRRSLKNRDHLFGFFDKKEIVAHEMCHVGRMAFEEPLFEEFFAYRTSDSAFRRRFGPIVKNSVESGVFVLLLFMIFMMDLFLILFGSEQGFLQLMWLKIFPLFMVGYGLFRLRKRHRQLRACLDCLRELSGSDSTASAIAYRLTDAEIASFGSWSLGQIRDFIAEQKEASLRWRMIDFCYFSFSH